MDAVVLCRAPIARRFAAGRATCACKICPAARAASVPRRRYRRAGDVRELAKLPVRLALRRAPSVPVSRRGAGACARSWRNCTPLALLLCPAIN